MPLLDHFGLLAPLYETFIQPAPPEDLIAHLGLPAPGGRLLDAGGGTGRVAQFLLGQADSIVVADVSPRMLAEARKKRGLHPACAHTERLPFADSTFARIIMVDALHHVCDARQTAGELWRVLQPGGRLVIEEPDVRTFAVKLIALAEKLALMRSRFLPPERIAALFPHSGAAVRMETGPHTAWMIVEKA